jgi:ferredoxin, 2Fe-2S
MAKIFVAPFRKEIVPLPDESIFTALRRNGFPIASSCLGDGVCAKCRITILRGAEHVTAPTAIEEKLIGQNAIENNIRLACQAGAEGDTEITTTYW